MTKRLEESRGVIATKETEKWSSWLLRWKLKAPSPIQMCQTFRRWQILLGNSRPLGKKYRKKRTTFLSCFSS